MCLKSADADAGRCACRFADACKSRKIQFSPTNLNIDSDNRLLSYKKISFEIEPLSDFTHTLAKRATVFDPTSLLMLFRQMEQIP